MKKLAVLAAGCMALGGSAASAHVPTRQADGNEACTASQPRAWARIHRHRLVELRASNPCPTRVVWISWAEGESSDSEADVLIVHPGAHFNWDAADLEDLAHTMRFPLGADAYAVGVADREYCFDVGGAAFEVTSTGVRPGSACPDE